MCVHGNVNKFEFAEKVANQWLFHFRSVGMQTAITDSKFEISTDLNSAVKQMRCVARFGTICTI